VAQGRGEAEQAVVEDPMRREAEEAMRQPPGTQGEGAAGAAAACVEGAECGATDWAWHKGEAEAQRAVVEEPMRRMDSGTRPRRCAASLKPPERGPGRCAATPREGRERGATAARPRRDSPARGTEGERAAGAPPAGSAVASATAASEETE
jgi:hypothetical protein